jgi:hypothetical protein
MEDFRKQYEYTEENRGLILLFVIMLLTIDLIHTPFYIVPVNNQLRHFHTLSIIFLTISIIFLLFIIFTAVTCYQLKRYMVILSKVYLIVRVVFMSFCIIILYLYELKSKTLKGNNYSNVGELTLMWLIGPLAFELVFSVAWYLYFLKSKRCKEIAQK